MQSYGPVLPKGKRVKCTAQSAKCTAKKEGIGGFDVRTPTPCTFSGTSAVYMQQDLLLQSDRRATTKPEKCEAAQRLSSRRILEQVLHHVRERVVFCNTASHLVNMWESTAMLYL